MIEKLDIIKHTENLYDKNGFITNVACGGVVIKKVNELIDTVNSIVSVQEKLIDSRFVVEKKHKEPLDRYIKQRKWVGKLCKFDGENYGILKEIGCSNTKQVWRDGAFRSSDGYWYDFCEPVKPDDDIIYKGE